MIAILLGSSGVTGFQHDAPELTGILDKAATYVRAYQDDFAHVIADENYVQTLTQSQTTRVQRIRSEALSVRVERFDGAMWIRNSLSVNGQPVPDAAGRLDRVIKGDSVGAAYLMALRNESARYNIGSVYRNFNEPTFVLRIFDADAQRRFRFVRAGIEIIGDRRTMRINFSERVRPTLIQNHDHDAPMSGTAWIDVADGTVLRTKMSTLLTSAPLTTDAWSMDHDPMMIVETRAEVDTDYQFDAGVKAWVPRRMREKYSQVSMTHAGRRYPVQEISCTAEYSNFRRFRTSARIVQQQ